MTRRLSLLHPFLFALFPVLSLAAGNGASAPISQVFRTAVLCLLFAALLWSALRLLLGNWRKAAVMTSIVWMVFFSYGHIHSFNAEFPLFRSRTLLPAATVLLVAAFWSLRRMKNAPVRLTQGLALISGLLVLLSASRIAAYHWRSRVELPARGARESGAGQTSPPMGNPDVYYIILDGYASADTLRDLYGYDNDPFLSSLRARGFYVADQSRSNYAQTPLSLASSTNMEYIGGSLESLGRRTKNIGPLFDMIEESRVMRAFKARGYTFVHFQSGWTVTGSNRNADWDVNCGGWGEFNRTLAKMTLLAAFDLFQPIEEQTRNRILCEFSTLEEIPRRVAGPRYVFAHFVFPETPLLFGRNGEPVVRRFPEDPVKQWGDKPGYVDQVVFANRKVTASIDRILAESRTPPIIVLQSDHGSASSAYTWMYGDEGPPATGREPGIDVFLRERMGILNVYHLPKGARGLYPSISPVNSFRVILNEYFGESYPLLEDRSFFSRYAHPYQFIDVTERVAAPSSGRGS